MTGPINPNSISNTSAVSQSEIPEIQQEASENPSQTGVLKKTSTNPVVNFFATLGKFLLSGLSSIANFFCAKIPKAISSPFSRKQDDETVTNLQNRESIRNKQDSLYCKLIREQVKATVTDAAEGERHNSSIPPDLVKYLLEVNSDELPQKYQLLKSVIQGMIAEVPDGDAEKRAALLEKCGQFLIDLRAQIEEFKARVATNGMVANRQYTLCDEQLRRIQNNPGNTGNHEEIERLNQEAENCSQEVKNFFGQEKNCDDFNAEMHSLGQHLVDKFPKDLQSDTHEPRFALFYQKMTRNGFFINI